MVLKYFMVNNARFLKGYHNRTYFYSSGTILDRVSHKLKNYMDACRLYDSENEDEASSEEDESEDSLDKPVSKKPPMEVEVMIRKVCLSTHTFACIQCVHIHTHVHVYKHSTVL